MAYKLYMHWDPIFLRKIFFKLLRRFIRQAEPKLGYFITAPKGRNLVLIEL